MKHARQMSVWGAVLVLAFMAAVGSPAAHGATEQAKQQAIDDGLAYLAATQATSGSEGYWSYANNGTLAATASAALAFIEEGYLPGDGSVYGNGVVDKACNYIFNRATADGRFTSIGPGGMETAVYTRYAEDYNNNGLLDDGGNNQGIYFNPGASNRNVYTTGVVAPVVYALGEALGSNTAVGKGSLTSGMTYKQVMQDVADWYSWAQVEPNRGSYRGGWQYDANSSTSDNSTAQWGALPILYAEDWGLSVPDYVKNELNLWADYIQERDAGANYGGSGYQSESQYTNVSKTGGLMLEFAAIGDAANDTWAEAARQFINGRWNNGLSATWYGNKGHPYAMWAAYKALEVYGFTAMNDNGTPGDTSDDFLIGYGMSNAPGGITIGQDWGTQTSAAGDWYSDYCDWLVNSQLAGGNWSQLIGSNYWYGPLQAGWYINILNAAGAPPPVTPVIPEPVTAMGLLLGVGCLARYVRRRRSR